MSIKNYFDIWYVEIKYRKTSGGENCRLGTVVLTENDCKEAAFLLKLDGGTGFRPRQNKPAGCFVNSYGDYAYFNTITDPSLTDNSFGSHLHGICTTIGTGHLFFTFCI